MIPIEYALHRLKWDSEQALTEQIETCLLHDLNTYRLKPGADDHACIRLAHMDALSDEIVIISEIYRFPIRMQ